MEAAQAYVVVEVDDGAVSEVASSRVVSLNQPVVCENLERRCPIVA